MANENEDRPRNDSDDSRRIDPTKNVLDLVEAAHRRVDDILDERDKRYEQRFIDQERAVGSALAAAEKAVDKAEVAAEKRFESLNDLRKVVTDLLSKTVTHAESEANFTLVREKIADSVAQWDTRHIELVDRVVVLDNKFSSARSEMQTKAEANTHAANDMAAHAEVNSRLADLDKRVSVSGGEKAEHKDVQATFRANMSMVIGIAAFVISLLLLMTRTGYLKEIQPTPAPVQAPQVIYVPAPQPAPGHDHAPIVVGQQGK